MIYGENNSNSANSSGVRGVYAGTSSSGAGVRGETISTATGAMGVFGFATATTGAIFGVVGTNSSPSNDAAGVLGYDTVRTAGGASFARTGVRGESENGNGVEGLSNAGMGVSGYLISTSGTILASGILGNGTGPQGVTFTGGLGGSGTKSFFEPHPTDPTKMIRYVSLEGPEAGTYFRGTAKTVSGMAAIQVPEDFRIVTDEDGLTVQVTPTGSKFTMVTVESADLNTIIVRTSRDVTFHYLVQGVRRAYKDLEVVTRNFLFVPRFADERMPEAYSPVERQRLIANGTYNADGTVNLETAERVGWTRLWKEREEQAGTAAADAARVAKDRGK